jgi:hypothetical protein
MISFRGASAPAATPLLAHVYGVKNIYTALIRLYTAYTLHQNREMYLLCMWTFGGVFWLYSTEMLVWQTVRAREGIIPLVTSTAGLVWMWMQREHYSP